MKISFRQILASAVGAVLAALIASSFGVKGTVVGVAIGSAVATAGTALVSQSIERGHKAVRQVVVGDPEQPILRNLGATRVAGGASNRLTQGTASDAVTEQQHRSAGGVVHQTVEGPASGPGQPHAGPTAPTPTPSARGDGTWPVTPVGSAPTAARSTSSALRTRGRTGRTPPIRWKQWAVVGAIVFVIALLTVTTIELAAGRSLSTLYGGNGVRLFGHPPPTTLPVTTTTAPSSSSTTSTPSTTSSTTSTTAPRVATSSPSTSTTSTSTSTTTTTAPTGTTPTRGSTVAP